MIESNYLYSELSDRILKAFYTVYNTLGYGFLEKVSDYFADIVVEEKIIIELKTAENIVDEHEAQLVNYLRATDIEVGLLLNFGKTSQHKLRVLTKEYK